MIKEAPPETFIRSEKQNKIGVKVYKGGVPYELIGTVSAFCILPDMTTIKINQNGSISGNSASVNLPDDCYEQDGSIQIAIILTNNLEITTLGVCNGTVYPSRNI